jgi:hypothetical protein
VEFEEEVLIKREDGVELGQERRDLIIVVVGEFVVRHRYERIVHRAEGCLDGVLKFPEARLRFIARRALELSLNAGEGGFEAVGPRKNAAQIWVVSQASCQIAANLRSKPSFPVSAESSTYEKYVGHWFLVGRREARPRA